MTINKFAAKQELEMREYRRASNEAERTKWLSDEELREIINEK